MGQGYSLTTPSSGSAGIDVPELSDLIYEQTTGSARFMKNIRARNHDGVVLVKALVKPYTPMPLEKYKRRIQEETAKLTEVPNALPYQRVIETETTGYLVRQYIYHSLYDRLSTRPFLEDIEKKWLAFQLLCAVRDCHNKNVYHGDIKSENVLVTSWNWLYLSDFSASFKPIMLPSDNPADFSYYFDTSARRTCYIAPERFLASGETAPTNAELTWAMDIFSVGCVIAELFLETSIFDLALMFKYRRGDNEPSITHLSRIQDKDLRDMISHMICIEPDRRYSAQDCLDIYKGKVFPEYFYHFLHQYMGVMTDPFSGQRTSNSTKNQGEADDRIDRVFFEFDKISYFLGYGGERELPPHLQMAPQLGLGHLPVRLSIPHNEHYVLGDAPHPGDDGTLIFLSLVVSSIRHTARAASKIRACDILLALSERMTDEAKLDRVLPYLVMLLGDKVDAVAISALRSITQLLDLVKVISPINAHIFAEYLFPRLAALLPGGKKESSSIVRATYASCLGSLAASASRFLDMASALNADGSLTVADPQVEPGTEAKTPFDNSFDDARRELFDKFEVHTKALIEDPDPYVRRAFLSSVPELCMFFGLPESNDIILTHLNTYLNDRDWTLKCAFFDTIVGIAAFIGSINLEEFILPLMVQALTDPEEHVVQHALHSLAELGSLGLLSMDKLLDLVDLVARFTMHPNMWIRESAVEFLTAAAKHSSPGMIAVMFYPRVKPYLKSDIVPTFAELDLLESLKKPLSRTVFDHAVMWAQKPERGLFWKPLQKLRRASFGAPLTGNATQSLADLNPKSLNKVPRNDDDEHWLSRLRKLGLTQEDEFKLLSLREFIWRLSQLKMREASTPDSPLVGQKLNLLSLGAKITTVIFDDKQIDDAIKSAQENPETGTKTYTLEAALQEAASTGEEGLSNDRRTPYASPANQQPGTLLHSRHTSTGLVSPIDADSPITQQTARRLPPPPGDDAASVDGQPRPARRIRHQSSAISLINRKDSNKSVPETATTQANVFGEVGAPYQSHSSRPHMPNIPELSSQSAKSRTVHTYEGNDPTVKKMLDNMYVDNFPYDIAEFGPHVNPIQRIKNKAGIQTKEPWKPTGTLVAVFGEHKAAINRVVMSPDHVFFVTGSDDGSVKVWDTARLEKNPAYRSRQTHRHETGSKVVGICFIENTHCFISAATDGSVHVVKVDCAVDRGQARYSRTRLLREYRLPTGEHASWLEHYKSLDGKSVLLIATNLSRVLAIDLRDMSLLYVLENPVHHGTPTCFCLDRKKNWLLLGTSHGVLDLWDLRFKMRLRGWGVPGKSAIYRLTLHPTKGKGKWVCCSGGTGQGEVTVWDLEKMTVREVYRVGAPSSKEPTSKTAASYEAWEVDEDKPEGMLGRFATSIEPSAAGNTDRGVRAMVAGSAGDTAGDVRNAFLITGGADKKLRFWDLSHIEASCVFSGLDTDEAKPSYTHYSLATTMTLNVERAGKVAAPSKDGKSGGGGGSSSRKGKPSRSTVISVQQQQLLRSHLDAIQDVAVLEAPYMMVVSVDRSGVVYVFS